MPDDQGQEQDRDEVSVAEAARLAGLSERTIRRMIAANALPARRVAGKRYAIQRQDLPAFAASPADQTDADLDDLLARLEEVAAQVEQVAQQLPPLLSQIERDIAPDSSPSHAEE